MLYPKKYKIYQRIRVPLMFKSSIAEHEEASQKPPTLPRSSTLSTPTPKSINILQEWLKTWWLTWVARKYTTRRMETVHSTKRVQWSSWINLRDSPLNDLIEVRTEKWILFGKLRTKWNDKNSLYILIIYKQEHEDLT